ncbi:MAG: hypothetical protein QOG91_14 [Candidatus Parcubacteria bacterium]|jgi:hypothetical protein|nr:hypothetical protein [Candidatus Parcubacteria bacterium]
MKTSYLSMPELWILVLCLLIAVLAGYLAFHEVKIRARARARILELPAGDWMRAADLHEQLRRDGIKLSRIAFSAVMSRLAKKGKVLRRVTQESVRGEIVKIHSFRRR